MRQCNAKQGKVKEIKLKISLDGAGKVESEIENIGHGLHDIDVRDARHLKQTLDQLDRTSFSHLQSQITDASRKMQEFGGNVQNFGNKIQGFGQTLTYGMTVPIIGLGVAAVKSFADVQLAVANISTIKPEINDAVLIKQLDDMSTRIPQTAAQLGDGLYNIFSSINVSQTEGLQLLEKFGKGATAAQTDAQTFGTAVVGVMNAYKLSVSDADHISDVFFNTVNAGVVNGQQLAQNLGVVTASAKLAGVSFDELGALIVGVTKEGGDASQNINNLANFLNKLPSKESSAALKELGISVADSSGKFRPVIDILSDLKPKLDGMTDSARTLALQNIFPDVQARQGAAVLLSQLDSVNQALKTNKETSGATESAYKKIAATASVQFSLLKNTSVAILSELGSAVLPVLQPLIIWLAQNLVPAVKQAVAAFQEWSPQMQTVAVVVAAFLAALGPVLVVVGTIVSAVGSIISAIGGLLPIFAAIGTAVASLGGFIIAFVGLIGEAGLVASFSALATVLGGAVVSAIGTFLSALAPVAVGVAAIIAVIVSAIAIGVALYEAYQTNFGGLKDFIDQVFSDISNVIQSALQAIVQFWNENGSQIVQTATDTFNSLIEFIRPIMTEIVSFMSESWKAIVEVAGPIFTQLVTLVQTHLAAISIVVQAVLSIISALWQTHGETIKAIVSAAWNLIKTIVVEGIRQIGNVITLVLAVINGDWKTAWSSLQKIVESAVRLTLGVLKNFGLLVWNILKLSFNFFDSLAQWVAQKAIEVGKSIIQGIVNGIKSGASWIADAAWDLGKRAISSLKESVDSHSPSREAHKVGAFVSEGFAIGMQSQSDKVISAAKKIATEAIKQFKEAQKEFAKLAGASPETLSTIQQANRISKATGNQQEIIKLRDELGVNNGRALPVNVGDTEAELAFLQSRKQSADDYVKSLDALNSGYQDLQNAIQQSNEAFDDRMRNLESSGEIALLNLQQEIDLLGETDKHEQQTIKNYYELKRVREQMSNDGYSDEQIAKETEILRIQQAQQRELNAILEVRKQIVAATSLHKDLNDQLIQLIQLQNGNRQLSEYEKTLKKLDEDFKDILPAQREQILNTARQVDQQKAYNEEYKKTYDFIRGSLDILTASGKSFGDKMKSIFGGVFNSFKKMLLDMAASWLTSSVLGGNNGNSNQSSSGGGFLSGLINSIRGIFGGNRSSASTNSGGNFGTPSFNPTFGTGGNFAGVGSTSGNQGSFGGINPIALLTGGGNISPVGGFRTPGGLTEQQLYNATNIRISGGGIASRLGSFFGKGGAGGGLSALAPLLGGQLGGKIGGGLGSIAGGALGLSAFAALNPALLATALPFGASSAAIIGFLANPFTIAAAGTALAVAYFIKRSKQRRKDETTRNTSMLDTLKGLNEIMAGLNANPPRGVDNAVSQSKEISANYYTMANSLKGKTKTIALKDGRERVDPLVTAIALQVPIAKATAANIDSRRNRLVAEFAGGNYFESANYGNFKRRNGMLPGTYTGRDYLPSLLGDGEMVLNKYQIDRVKNVSGFDPFKYAKIPNYADGVSLGSQASSGSVGSQASTSNQINFTPTINIQIEGGEVKSVDIQTPEGQRVLTNVLVNLAKNKELKKIGISAK